MIDLAGRSRSQIRGFPDLRPMGEGPTNRPAWQLSAPSTPASRLVKMAGPIDTRNVGPARRTHHQKGVLNQIPVRLVRNQVL